MQCELCGGESKSLHGVMVCPPCEDAVLSGSYSGQDKCDSHPLDTTRKLVKRIHELTESLGGLMVRYQEIDARQTRGMASEELTR